MALPELPSSRGSSCWKHPQPRQAERCPVPSLSRSRHILCRLPSAVAARCRSPLPLPGTERGDQWGFDHGEALRAANSPGAQRSNRPAANRERGKEPRVPLAAGSAVGMCAMQEAGAARPRAAPGPGIPGSLLSSSPGTAAPAHTARQPAGSGGKLSQALPSCRPPAARPPKRSQLKRGRWGAFSPCLHSMRTG